MTDNLPTLDLKQVDFRVLPMRTRFPFKYGIASLTALPHLVLQAKVEVNGAPADGIASARHHLRTRPALHARRHR